jgi:hypothetical protein
VQYESQDRVLSTHVPPFKHGEVLHPSRIVVVNVDVDVVVVVVVVMTLANTLTRQVVVVFSVSTKKNVPSVANGSRTTLPGPKIPESNVYVGWEDVTECIRASRFSVRRSTVLTAIVNVGPVLK